MFELVPAKISSFGQSQIGHTNGANHQPTWPTRLGIRICVWFINQTIRRHRSLATGICLIDELQERLSEQTTENDRLARTLNAPLKAAESAQEELGMLRVALGVSQRRYFELLAGRDVVSLASSGNSIEKESAGEISNPKRKNPGSARKKRPYGNRTVD